MIKYQYRLLFVSSREAESENGSLVVQGMLMKFECRLLKRMILCINFDV